MCKLAFGSSMIHEDNNVIRAKCFTIFIFVCLSSMLISEDEAMMVEDIVKHIARELSAMQPIQMGDIIGMDAHMEQIDPLLDMDSTANEVRMIGIWGMGGIGKTTIAKCLYKKYSPRFAHRFCFIENIRNSAENGLPGLQKELLSKIISDKEKGCTIIKSNLKKLKVLLVLDDVDNVEQLRALAKETSWFGPGSRIIITTRDLGLLYFYGMRFVYHVNFLGNDDSIRVFKNVAFDGGRAPSDVYEQLSIRASKLAQGLPSALDAFGTYLRQMTSIEAWEKALSVLEKFPPQSIMDILRTSYEGLDKRDQAVFLHLACLFNGDTVHRVTTLLDDGDIRIKRLQEKSLIDISPDGCIAMHVLVEQAGREIVLQESKYKLWRQRILWEPEEIVSVLQNTTVSVLNIPHVLMLVLSYCQVTLGDSLLRVQQQLKGLDQLRRLDVSGSKNLTELPDLSRATLLEELIMKDCTGLKRAPDSIGRLSCLRKLDLSHCDGLMNLQTYLSEKTVLPERGLRRRRQIILRLPGAVKKLSSLANLSIEGKIHIGLWHLKGNAEHLSFISEQQIRDEMITMPKVKSPMVTSFYDFKSLSIKRFSYTEDGSPFRCISFSGFPCLAELSLINLNIKKIPDDIGLLHSLEKLDLSGNDFRSLPTSMKNLSNLKYLRLSHCINLEAFPELNELQTLKLSGCSNLKSLLELSHAVQDVGRYILLQLELENCKNVQPLSDELSHFTNLIYLDLSGHDFEAIPESITELLFLGTLCVNNCKKLKSVEELPRSLEHLYAHGCDSLENVAISSNHSIKHLDLSHCFNLQQDEYLITRFLNGGYSQEVSQRTLCLPGTRVPRYFDNRSSGTSTKISLPPITFTPTLVSFAACIMISCEKPFNLEFPAFSYDWNCEDDEVIRINLKPNLYRSSENEEEETVASHHLVIIHIPSSINTEKIEEFRLESHLQFPDEFRFPPGEINSCGAILNQTIPI
ncbi:unnamed protein product [Thlaspi arvense]|uniref:ADP-ribosyl cyclase/cyclic ADP-ribose hydrolase n=1 Tax=Thlaspi arvense TaxID=13288 RepID=A0AAU9SM93_THLAR|nr:unnamed protein product [Thlaspi arvense]